MRKNIFLTEEEWQQRIEQARREIAAAQARLEESKLALAIAKQEAKDKRERKKA